LVAAEIDQIKP